MRKIIIITGILILAITAMAIKYFSNLSSKTNNVTNALQHIPEDAALIVNFTNDDSFYEIFKDYELFNAIIGLKRSQDMEFINQTILQSPEIKEFTIDKNIFISFHPNAQDSVDFLYTINLNEQIAIDDIDDAFKNDPNFKVEKDSNNGIYTIRFTSLNKPFFIYIEKGAATGSFSAELLLKSINKDLKKADDKFVQSIIDANAKNNNSPVNIYINHNKFPAFASKFLNGKPGNIFSIITNINGISSLNMNFKSDGLMFNGISEIDTGGLSYANLFLSQKPVKNNLKQIFPDNTSYFVSFGISNFPVFNQKLNQLFSKRKETLKNNQLYKQIQDETGLVALNEMHPLLGNEFAVLQTTESEKLGLISLKNGREVDFKLQLLSEAASSHTRKLKYSHLFYSFFADPLKQFVQPYYAIIDNYLVIANSSSAIERYLKKYEQKKLLSNVIEFTEHNQYIGNQSNIFYFFAAKNSSNFINKALRKNYAVLFKDPNYGLNDFYGFSYQWTADDGHFFTNIYASYKSSQSFQLSAIWQTDIGAKLAIQPQIIPINNGHLLFIQDKSNNLHALSLEGKIVWSKQLDGKIKGEIKKINDNELVFCTSNQLYKINPKGSFHPNFPVKLELPASFGLTFVNQKIFIPCGRSILAYDLNGEKIVTWNRTLDGNILFDLKTLTLNNEHYLVTGTENGIFYIYDDLGELINKITDKQSTLYKNEIFLEKGSSLNDSRIIAADTSGQVIYVTLNGQLSKKQFDDINAPQSFDFVNISGDEYPEHVFAGEKQITAFAKDGSLLWKYPFNNNKKLRSLTFAQNNFLHTYGVYNSTDNEFYLFKEDGSLIKGFPINHGDYFLVNKLANGKRIVICNKANTIIAYQLN